MIDTPGGAVRGAPSAPGAGFGEFGRGEGDAGTAARAPRRASLRAHPYLLTAPFSFAPMRPLLLVLLVLFAAACASPEPEAPPASAPAPRAEPALATDSLLRAEPEVHYRIAIGFPRIEGDDRPAVRRVNAAIRDSLTAFADGLRPTAADFSGDPEMDRMFVGEAEGGPAKAFLSGRVFSSRVDIYTYTGGAHGNLIAYPFSYDLATGEPIRLGDLFLGGTAYLDTLAARVTERLVADRGTGWMFEDEIPPDPDYFSVFTLGADSLTIFFPPYAIASYAAGPSEVSLPYAALRDVIDEGGPVGWLRPRPAGS